MKHTNTCHVLSVCTERGMHHCSFDTKKALLCRPALNLLCYSIRQLCSYPPFLPTAFRWFCNSPLPPTPSDRNVLLMSPCSKCVHSERSPWHMHHCSFDTKKALLCRPALNLFCYSIRQLCSYPPFLPTAFRWFCNSPLPPTPSDRNVLLMFPCSKCVHSERNPWHMHHCSFVSS